MKEILEIVGHSDTAETKGINNDPPKEVIANAFDLFSKVITKLMFKFGRDIVINSWYRSPELNKRVGGSKTSDHLKGYAIDFTYSRLNMLDVYKKIIKCSGIEFKQCIYYPKQNFIHIAIENKPKMRQQSWIEGKV